MSDPKWSLAFTRSAERDIRRLDPPVRRRVGEALTALTLDPLHPGLLRKLTGQPEYRLRIGDWRAIVALDPTSRVITVMRVLPRGRAYDR
jgi:mRNA interferase RelE/StbE